jgi:hypothetical protein
MSPLSTHQPDMSIKLKLLDTTTQPVEIGDRVRNGVREEWRLLNMRLLRRTRCVSPGSSDFGGVFLGIHGALTKGSVLDIEYSPPSFLRRYKRWLR